MITHPASLHVFKAACLWSVNVFCGWFCALHLHKIVVVSAVKFSEKDSQLLHSSFAFQLLQMSFVFLYCIIYYCPVCVPRRGEINVKIRFEYFKVSNTLLWHHHYNQFKATLQEI